MGWRMKNVSVNKVEKFRRKWEDAVRDVSDIKEFRCEEFFKDYETLMHSVLLLWFGVLGKAVRAEIISDLGFGNASFFNAAYEQYASVDMHNILKELFWDIYYCSDRWNWDRFLRVNFRYHLIKWRRKIRVDT